MSARKFIQAITTIIVLVLLVGCNGTTSTPIVPTRTASPPTALPTSTQTETIPSPQPTSDLSAGAPGIGDSLYPNFGNGGYDVQHYTLDLTVHNVETGDLSGVVTMDAQATQTLSSFNLDFIGFEIESITVNGQAADFSRDGQELTITPSEQLEEGDAFRVETVYQGEPEQVVSEAIPILTGWVLSNGESYVVSEPDGAANYFPVNDHPLDKASFTFRITVPKPFEVAANGTLTETIDNGDSTTYLWEAPFLMASYLATINITDFDLETMDGPNGITIRNYYAVGLPDGVSEVFARQGEMIEFFSGLFGPFPNDVYGAVVVNSRIGGALETRTLAIYGSDMIDLNDIASTETVVAHEIAHEWFGNEVSLADWSDIWLNEGFATYAEGLWIEHLGGSSAYDAWVREVYSFADRTHTRWSPPGSPEADQLFNANVYYWGSLTLHALRVEVGDDDFFEILRTYYARHQGGNASTADFILVAEEISGLDLQAFFDDWLYSTELPPLP